MIAVGNPCGNHNTAGLQTRALFVLISPVGSPTRDTFCPSSAQCSVEPNTKTVDKDRLFNSSL